MIHSRLPPALNGRRTAVAGEGPGLCAYASEWVTRDMPAADAATASPLLLVHSVNASASAAEVKPLFDRYGSRRPTLALELPGFGTSQRGALAYTPQLMAQSVLRAAAHLRSLGFRQPIDVLALSLSCEFVALAVHDQPRWFRSVALVNPTGLESPREEHFDGGRTKDKPWLRRLLSGPIGEPVFQLLTTSSSMRWFLERTWGSPVIDEALLSYGHVSAHRPGARHAPAAFIGGALFTQGIAERYALIEPPVWLAHGVRGEFADFGGLSRIGPPAHWSWDTFGTGAMPHLEAPRLFISRYEAFLERVVVGLSSRDVAVAQADDKVTPLPAMVREKSRWGAAPVRMSR